MVPRSRWIRSALSCVVLVVGCAHGSDYGEESLDAGRAVAGPPDDFDITVHGVTLPCPFLEVSITNRTRKTLTVFTDFLPWNDGWFSELDAIDSKGVPIQLGVAVDGYGPDGKTTFQPGQTRRGVYFLGDSAWELDQRLRQGDITVFWGYRLQPREETPFPMKRGVVHFLRDERVDCSGPRSRIQSSFRDEASPR